ncbi:hypothetical protein [Brevundimonas lenta]|uniref:Porin domain-containing protein n=1 Tax=Brevundimonas lenta TaxID=424796 RepID=A0A7W6NPU8_9CAUL|nr:hypothetical protein [Brevundimonas lenta]MBB4082550.1 hypothetical protein [Brevundimonas lenta]
MKSLFLATAAVAALAAAPALAQDGATVGSAGIAYANSQADIGPFEAEGEGAVGDVSVATVVGDWTLTGATQVTYADSDADFGDNVDVSGSVHVTREFGNVRAGGFVSGTDVGDTLWTVGAQAQTYLGNATVGGVASYGTVKNVDVWTLGADVGYFVTPDLRIDANAGYNSIDFDGFDTEALTYGVGGEYKFAGSPVSVFGGWDRVSLDDADLDIDTFSLGVRISFGGDLKARDRSGADLGRKLGGVTGAVGFLTDFSVAP